MILPTNGKVVVFDDKYEEVKALLTALSKQKIPYFYFYEEDGSDLPDTQIENVRLVFLDLLLVNDNNAKEENIISAISARLTKVLEPNSNYILVYWSTKEDKYGHAIKIAFEDRLSNYKPILTISLDKVKAKTEEDPIAFIIDNIHQNAEDFKVLKVFSFWENIVNNSSGELINNFINFIDKDKKWDDVAKYLLYKLAYAYGGKETLALNEIDKIKNSFYTLNHSFIDTLENNISKSLFGKDKEFKEVISTEGDDSFKTIVNKKLLIAEDSFNGDLPGTFFLVDNEIQEQFDLIQFTLDKVKQNQKIPSEQREDVIAKAQQKAVKDIDKVKIRQVALKSNYNNIVNSLLRDENRGLRSEIVESSVKIELNVSPICDYAQQKMPCCRILPGLLIKKDYPIEKGNAFNYISDAIINFDGIDYLLVFDFKYLYSIQNSTSKKRQSNFKLRQQLLADIQVKLGSHINRAGVLYL
ncbi:hypothetical protein QWY90_06000 [Flavobacterium paronense]|uniref:Response receiver domain-containing protein n=1 Tax=Flavobacterium paronense TaxID=1392775 RepID=A0ABV5GB69_9FLAO|nr:hypothetical protein [Flavobacterium paronense]MDN3676860.1 hypothetical protein [Flavobacterium paronense]